jgi:hypothetical protein
MTPILSNLAKPNLQEVEPARGFFIRNLKKYMFVLLRPTANKIYLLIFYISKKLKIGGG